MVGQDGITYLMKEYSAKVDNTFTATADLAEAPNQMYTVYLELAGLNVDLPASNSLFEVTWGNLGESFGEFYSQPYDLQEDVRSLRLSWAGVGVALMVSTDNKLWETVENGKVTLLKNPGRRIWVKGLLKVDPNTVLDGYQIEVNPAKYSLFTGKTLEESTGLVYFGRRWYDPEFGRFVSVDPAEDGENWYGYCGGDPINYVDPDGSISERSKVGELGEESIIQWLKKNGHEVVDVGKHVNATGPDVISYKNGVLHIIDNKESSVARAMYYVKGFKNQATFDKWLVQIERTIRKANMSPRLKRDMLAALKQRRIKLTVTTSANSSITRIGPGLKRGVGRYRVRFFKVPTVMCAISVLPDIICIIRADRISRELDEIREGSKGKILQERLIELEKYYRFDPGVYFMEANTPFINKDTDVFDGEQWLDKAWKYYMSIRA